MQHPAIPNKSPLYTKLGELSDKVQKYADGLKSNKDRQDARKEKNKESAGTAILAAKNINVIEVLVTRREGISQRYNSIICALERCTDYDIVELVDYLPEDKEQRRAFLEALQLPFKAIVSDGISYDMGSVVALKLLMAEKNAVG